MKETLDIINKYGITAIMAIAIVWFNSRLNDVETKLYDCWEAQIISSRIKTSNYNFNNSRPVAVLPQEIKIKRE